MRFLRKCVIAIAITFGALASVGCTPAEIQVWTEHVNMSKPSAVERGMTDEGLERLRMCESGGRYDATNPSGKYRGAYQFDQSTWDSVASRWAPFLVGRDPATVNPHWQDHLALALYSERGPQPWPHCGKRI